ncbi:ABC transporter substrate-binding protein [Microbacterium aurantiacum]|uniref:ABC transporter substrate-binding protein n=1 Tax=Microbacterium aurantiacum TaxID=162393 RepID=UPI001F431E2F|nr:ABC transporter substrate-binding protein [Microbacterium aurantiacum]
MSHHRIPTRRAATFVAVVATAVLALAGCAGTAGTSTSSGAAGEDRDLSVQLSWILNEQFSPDYLADANGYNTAAGLGQVTLIPGPSNGVGELLAGSANIAITDIVSIGAAIANEGAPLKVIGAGLQRNPYTLVSLASSGIETPADLVGRRIGVQDGNTALIAAFLQANGIDESQVTIVPVQYDPAPLANGEVDAFVAYLTNEPITLSMQGLDVANLSLADNGMPFVGQVIAVTNDEIATHRADLEAFLEAKVRGWNDFAADPQVGVDLALSQYGKDLDLDPQKAILSAEQIIELATSDDTAANGMLTVSEDLQDSTITSLQRAGITISAADLFDLSLLEEVYADHPDLR